MEKPQFVASATEHLKEKAPAYALAVVVAVGSLALMGEGNGEDPSVKTDAKHFISQTTPEHFEHQDVTLGSVNN